MSRVTVPLSPGVMPDRVFYAMADFMTWMGTEVPKLKTGRLQASQTPQEQLDAILLNWTAGKPMAYSRAMNDLMPGRDEVWEMKTPDLRIFGWICLPRTFVAVFGDYADWYKRPTIKKSYGDARERVISARHALNLDEPKIATGVYDALV